MTQTASVAYIFVNSFKKVYFVLMFDIVSSSKTTVKGKKTKTKTYMPYVKPSADSNSENLRITMLLKP